MDNKVRVLTPSQISSLADDVDLNSINRELNDHIKIIKPKINFQDLGDWRMLISVLTLSTNGIGVFRRTKRYPSDKEFEITIAIPIPDDSQALYGLSKVKDDFFSPLIVEKFYNLEPKFDQYSNLYDYIFESSKLAINLAFTEGFTCNGKKIKFQSAVSV